MASAALLRSIRRRDVVSAPLSVYKSLASNAQPLQGSSYIRQNCASLCRAFSSKSVGNDVVGTVLGTTNTCNTVLEGKNPKAIDSAIGARITPGFVAFNQKQELLMGSPSLGTKHLFSTKSDDPQTHGEQSSPEKHAFRPLSPHLPVYEPQLNSMLSIFHRISGAYLSGIVLFGYLIYVKMGSICFTYPSFYQFLTHVSKQIPIFTSVTALAMFYHVVKGTHSLMTHAKPFPKLFR